MIVAVFSQRTRFHMSGIASQDALNAEMPNEQRVGFSVLRT